MDNGALNGTEALHFPTTPYFAHQSSCGSTPTAFHVGLEHLLATETYTAKWIAFGYATGARHESGGRFLIVNLAAELCICGAVHFAHPALAQLVRDTINASGFARSWLLSQLRPPVQDHSNWCILCAPLCPHEDEELLSIWADIVGRGRQIDGNFPFQLK